MDAPQHLLLLLTLSGVLSRPSDHRNLFTQRACCRRQSHVVFIGQDISGGPVSVDVGLCRSHCGAAGGSSQARGLQEQSWSILDFLRSKKRRARGPPTPESTPPHNQLPSCGMNQVCAPAGVRVERVLLFEGPREVEVIQECHCEVRLSQCMRVPALKTYYSETPHEAVLDVGGCSRSKGSPEGFSCLPTRFDSVLVETPNRVEQVQTVVDCELKETCYRVPHVEYYYEIVHHENGVKEEKLREIDVGRCLGGCSTGNRCLLRGSSDPESCYLWSERQSSSCVPEGYEIHSLVDHHVQPRTVLSITSCFCHS
uniref:Im:7138239 n=1 Tax=Oryzias latipes TaxID=8090 RepID=A0A3P9LQK2_ORYLA